MKRLSLLLVVFGMFALVVSGCSGEKEQAGDEEETATKPAEGEEAEAAADEGEEAEEAAAEEEAEDGEEAELGEIGVEECDEYVEKYMSCIDEHVPEEASAEMLKAFKDSQAQWAEAAQDEEARETLAETCTQALAQAQEAMQAYDCEW